MALWELADLTASRRGAYETPEAEAEPEPEPGAGAAPKAAEAVGRRGRVAYAAAVAVALVCGAAIGLGVSRPAHPATPDPLPAGVRCHGKSCAGKSPISMKCGSPPRSLGLHRAATGAQLEIRYSVKCGAAWARIWKSRIGDRIEVSAPSGPTRTTQVTNEYEAESYLFTLMVTVVTGDQVRACVKPAGGTRECFTARVGP
jgi:hypothetical protein